MAQLTDQSFARIWQRVYSAGFGKEELKAHATLPTKAQARAAFQTIEDWWDAAQGQVKADFDAALGVTTTQAEARKIAAAWVEDKLARLRGQV
jgi:hypothetical protein